MNLLDCIKHIVTGLPYFGILFLFLLLGKIVYDKTTSYKFDEELTEKDNPAFGIHFGLYMIGLSIALMGTLYGIGSGEGPMEIVSVLIFSAIAIVLMRISVYVCDMAILNKFSVHKEMIEDKNRGTGFAVGGAAIAGGLTINGALSGNSDSLALGVFDVIVYFVVAQVILAVAAQTFQKITSYDVHSVIEHDDNEAAGLSFGGFLVGTGIIIRSSLVGADSGLVMGVITTLIVAAAGVLFLCLGRVITDKILLPKSPLSKEVAVDKNIAAGWVAASVFIGVALAFSAVI